MANTEIYYFSGTGNSLVIARDLSEKLDGPLIPIPSVMGSQSIQPGADVIGIVFPVYYIGCIEVPLMVREFIRRLEGIENKYIFAVCNYGGGAYLALRIMRELLEARGGKLAAGFGMRMPQNAFIKKRENKPRLFRREKKKIEKIADYVSARKTGKFDDGSGILIKIVMTFMLPGVKKAMEKYLREISGADNLSAGEMMAKAGRGFHAEETCTGCGICVKVCPSGNITLKDKKPVWGSHCENCLACYSWCPSKSIRTVIVKDTISYRHPEVKVSQVHLR